MCDRCIELDNKVSHYGRMASQITDRRALDGIDDPIRQMTAEKTAMLCGPDNK